MTHATDRVNTIELKLLQHTKMKCIIKGTTKTQKKIIYKRSQFYYLAQ